MSAMAAWARWRGASDPLRLLVVIVLWLLLGVFVLYPLIELIRRALSDDAGLTLAPLIAAIHSKSNLRAFGNSLLLATLVGICGTALGFLFAFTVERTTAPKFGMRLLDIATLLPLISPPFTTSIAFVFSFGPRGFITHDLLGMNNATVYGLSSTLAAETLTYFPLAYMALRPMLAAIGSDIEEMALSLGSSRWRVFRTVTLPLTLPGLANAFLLLFAASLADFATPLILAGNNFPLLPTEAFLQITGLYDLKGGAAMSLLLLVPAALVYFVQRYWVERGHYVTISGKAGPQSAIRSVTAGTRWVLILVCLAVALFIAYLYALLLHASLVVAFGANHAWTLAHYHVIFTEGRKAITDTLIIALSDNALVGFYGVSPGYRAGTQEFIGRRTMEVVFVINYAMPGPTDHPAFLIACFHP